MCEIEQETCRQRKSVCGVCVRERVCELERERVEKGKDWEDEKTRV